MACEGCSGIEVVSVRGGRRVGGGVLGTAFVTGGIDAAAAAGTGSTCVSASSLCAGPEKAGADTSLTGG
eukprot:5993657-Amphidinium_carterae.1